MLSLTKRKVAVILLRYDQEMIGLLVYTFISSIKEINRWLCVVFDLIECDEEAFYRQ